MKKLLVLIAILASFVFALDVNTASKQDFANIKGIGDKKAQAIVDLREKLGGKFAKDSDLLQVKGIGKKTLANIKNDVVKKSKKGKKQNKKINKNKQDKKNK